MVKHGLVLLHKAGSQAVAKDEDKPAEGESAEENPFSAVRKRLNRYRFLAVLGAVACLLLLAGSVATVVYSGMKSMAAFEDLPKYRVNRLVLDYRDRVKQFDQSNAATRIALEGEIAQWSLAKARDLSAQLLTSELAFEQLLANYAEAMALASEQVGGALEWNRYFQADIQSLKDNSLQRRSAIQGVFDQFPIPNLPEPEAQNETGGDSAPNSAGQGQ